MSEKAGPSQTLMFSDPFFPDTLLFDEDERGPGDTLRLQFEALQQFDDEERQTAQAVLEGLILKHQAKQSQLRMQQPARTNEKKRATR